MHRKMIAIFMQNEGFYTRQVTYFIRCSCIWTLIDSLRNLVHIVHLAATLHGYLQEEQNLAACALCFLIYILFLAISAVAFKKSQKLYFKQLGLSTYSEFKSATSLLHTCFTYSILFSLGVMGLVPILIMMLSDPFEKFVISRRRSELIALEGALWSAYFVFCFAVIVPLLCNLWLMCLYRKRIKPFIDSFTEISARFLNPGSSIEGFGDGSSDSSIYSSIN